MKIDAIGVNYNLQGTKNLSKLRDVHMTSPPVNQQIKQISFRGGNKNQVIYWGMELRPYSALGGISTVLRDHRGLKASESGVIPEGGEKNIDYWKQPDKVFVDPLYNGMEVYDYNTGIMQEAKVGQIPKGLKSDSAFKKYEGMYFYTSDQKFKSYANELEFFNNEEIIVPATQKPKLELNKNIHIIKEVGEPMKMDFGGDKGGETTIRLFRVHRFDSKTGELVPINDFKVMTDVSLTWKKPYEGGGYASAAGALAQTWRGDGDARSSKAFVKLTQRICDEVSKDGNKKYDPATILLNDSHAANVVEYMAQEAVKGDEFWLGKKAEVIGHNLASGYIQRTSYMNMFVNIADKELREAVKNDPDFIDAVLKGNDAVDEYFKKLLPAEIIDKQGGVSPFQNTIYYAEKGYVPKIMTVSEGYHQASVTNRDLIPGQFEQLQKLAKDGVYIGITNGSTGINPYEADKNPYFSGYTFANDAPVDKVKGKSLTPYKLFDKTKTGAEGSGFDIKHIREIKQHNKAALLERFDIDVLNALKKMQTIKGKEYEYSSVIAAAPDRKVDVLGYIDSKYINAAKQSKNSVKLLISWGRGDTQKGLDSVLRSFSDYVEKFGSKDPNVVLVAGGELPEGKEGDAIKALIDKMNNNPNTKGRFVFLDGFAPNKPLIMAADFAVLPSRFAPCELTDLESIKGLCPPIVSNCQGLGQKNFDATFEGEAGKVTGYKTRHDYYMTLDELMSQLEPDDKAKFEKEFKKFKDGIAHEYKHKYNKTLTDAEIMEKILEGRHYEYMFEITRPYRDKVIEKELVNAYVRALQTDFQKDIQTTMLQNDVKLGIGWENNAALSKFNKTSGQLYREAFQLDAKVIKEEDTLLYKLRQNCKEILEKYRRTGGRTSGNHGGLFEFLRSTRGKWTIAGAAVAALMGATAYIGNQSGWKVPKLHKKEDCEHLSCIA